MFYMGKCLHSKQIRPGVHGASYRAVFPVSGGGRVPYRAFAHEKDKAHRTEGDWKYIWIVGGLGYFVSITFQLIGTKLLDASLASLINGMNPITISLLAAVFLKEKIRKRHIASICISIAGYTSSWGWEARQ